MYSEKILELFKNPINAGGLQGANGVGKFVDNACGDNIKIYLKIDENGIISEARFKAMGSVGTIVASSAICSCVLDCTTEEALEINNNRIQEITGSYEADKSYCLDYAKKALALAIEDYFVKLEKAQKKAEKDGLKETKNLKKESETAKVLSKQSQQTEQIANERRTVSAAKAAFDAMFE